MNMEPKDYKNIFSKRLKELRTERGETQQVACKEIDIHINTLKNYENGERLPNLGEFLRIKDHYGVSFEYLIGESDIKNPDITLQEVGKITGLSQNAITCLNKSDRLNKKRVNIINFLIEHENKYKFISTLEAFLMSRIEHKDINKNIINNTEDDEVSNELKYLINNPKALSDMLKCSLDRILYRMERDMVETYEKK